MKANTQTSKITLGIEQKYLHIKAAASFNIHFSLIKWKLNETPLKETILVSVLSDKTKWL